MRYAVYVASFVCLSAALLAQTPTSSSTPSFKSQTRLVALDAIVTDKQGKAVSGLTKDDFIILEEGVPQRASFFSAEKAPAANAGQVIPTDGFVTNANGPTDDAGTVVILLDEHNTAFTTAAYARYELKNYLQKGVLPGHRVALFVLGSGVKLLQDFTDSSEQLLGALKKHKPFISWKDEADDLRLNEGWFDYELFSQLAPAQQAKIREKAVQDLIKMQRETDSITFTLRALQMVANATSGTPGRKSLIWISSGFPLDFNDGELRDAFKPTESYYALARETSEYLTNARVSVYPADARGLANLDMYDATSPQFGIGGRRYMGYRINSLFHSQAAMETIAELTGGKAYRNQNDIAGFIAKTVAESGDYYSLAYRPSNPKWDGKFRKIEVKVRRPDLKVRARKGYYATEPESPSAEVNARRIQFELMNPLQIHGVRFNAKVEPAAESPLISILVRPETFAAVLSVPESAEPAQVTLQVVVANITSSGSLNGVAGREMQIVIPAKDREPIRKDGFPFSFRAAIPMGTHHLRVLLRNTQTNEIGTLDVPITTVTAPASSTP